MCTGAVYWSGISRVVYALDQGSLHQIAARDRSTTLTSPPCQDLLARGNRHVAVDGPALESEALAVHAQFWHHPRG